MTPHAERSDERSAQLHRQLWKVFGVPYPLAHHQPYVAGRQRVYDAQAESNLDPEFALVAFASNQLILTLASQSFLDRVIWDEDIATGWRPAPDPGSTVRMDPDVRFGKPAVGGVSTEVVWEQSEAGESVDDLAEMFGLSVNDVRCALAYESAQQAQTEA